MRGSEGAGEAGEGAGVIFVWRGKLLMLQYMNTTERRERKV